MNNENCGCCQGIENLTPVNTANRPGLNNLFYRVGTHATFLAAMKAQLSSSELAALANLKTRNANDPAIAILDAWATVADVLTFYQERIANEGYLRTATERRSLLELARLVGYNLRPGVAATVYPAFTLETGYNQDTEILIGTKIQSVPNPGEMPQSFETVEKINARADWNSLHPRLTRPHYITLRNIEAQDTIYLQGISTNLKANDPILFIFGNSEGQQIWRKILTVAAESDKNRTLVKFQPKFPQQEAVTKESLAIPSNLSGVEKLNFANKDLLQNLLKPASVPPANASALRRDTQTTYASDSDIAPQLITNLKTKLRDTFYAAWQNTPITNTSSLQSLAALRVKASLFGHNAPLKPIYDREGRIFGYEEWAIAGLRKIIVAISISSNSNPRQIFVSLDEDTNTYSVIEALTDSVFPKNFDFGGKNVSINYTPFQQTVNGGGNIPHTITVTFQDGESIRSISQPNNISWGVQTNNDDTVIINPNQTRQYASKNPPGKVRVSFNSEFSTPSAISSISLSTREPILTIEYELPTPVDRNIIALDAQYDQILPESWIAIERPESVMFRQVEKVATISKVAYNLSAKVTQLTLKQNWLGANERTLDVLRNTTVYAQTEKLPLADEVINPKIELVAGNEIELAKLYDGLQPGRWLIISGERTDLDATTGIKASELVMLSAVYQRVATVFDEDEEETKELPGDKIHTFIQLAKPLNYQYKRDTVTIYANVAKATHGETRSEILGSGDASKSFQQFPLRQPPLTYLAAPTPVGAKTTLEIRVNDVLWSETDSLTGLKSTERVYTLKTDDNYQTTVIFGNGESGSLLPTGRENVKAMYRNGIGKVGNLKAEQINLLVSRPLGLKGVINPLPATGGADRESTNQVRQNAPLTVMSLDRLVSIIDYADFARTFAGIGKASATQLSDGNRQVVHITIAGAEDIPIDKSSDLYRNLYQALRQLGDPYQPIQLETRELLALIMIAKVKILPEYQWQFVEPKIRQHLLSTFSFERRELGQDVTLSEVISTIQQVPGVDFVDVDVLDTVSETEAVNPDLLIKKLEAIKLGKIASDDNDGIKFQPSPRITVNLARREKSQNRFLPEKLIQPAQLAIILPTEPRTLILNPL
ncbi:putative baseplate assembly protein [Nostoc muscorum FACHB-395]|nr:putative baseplate assembly protein [Desmonostoc muscorum FACHB-395]